MGPEHRPRQREQVLTQQATDTLLLLDPHGGQYYALDEVGARVWGLCDGAHSVAQIVALLAAEYDAPAETIEVDVTDLLTELASEKLVIA